MAYASDCIPVDILVDLMKGYQSKLPMYIPEYYIHEEDCRSVPDRIQCLRTEQGTNWSSHGTTDHPSFTRLRKHLAAKGIIDMNTTCVNGDIVLKRFILNDVLFDEGDRFLSADPMNFKLFKRN